jgi:hypothetical protein
MTTTEQSPLQEVTPGANGPADHGERLCGRVRIAEFNGSVPGTVVAFDREAAQIFDNTIPSRLGHFLLSNNHLYQRLRPELQEDGLYCDDMQVLVRPPLRADLVEPLAQILVSDERVSAPLPEESQDLRVLNVIDNHGWRPDTSWDVQATVTNHRGSVIASASTLEASRRAAIELDQAS